MSLRRVAGTLSRQRSVPDVAHFLLSQFHKRLERVIGVLNDRRIHIVLGGPGAPLRFRRAFDLRVLAGMSQSNLSWPQLASALVRLSDWV